MLHRSTSIESKLTRIVLAAVLLAAILAAMASAWRETERSFAAEREMLAGLAASLAAVTSGPLERGDRPTLATRLNSVRHVRKIKSATVYDATGEPVYETGLGIQVAAPDGQVVANQSLGTLASLRLGTYLVSMPVTHGGQAIGRIALVADLSDLRLALARSLAEALLTGLVGAALAVLAARRLQRSITAPILALTQATEAIRGSGDYTHAVARTTDDETGRLVVAFNAMMGEITDRDDELRRQRDRLADEVAERTHDLRLAKDAAESANAAKSEFLATMSHEIRTPMNGMLVMAELLAASQTDAKARRQCAVIVKSGQVLLSLINDILDLSKIEAGHLELESVPCDPADIVETVLQLFAERAAGKGLQLACEIPADTPISISGDPLRLQQILSNLVNNALKFTESGGVLVRLAVERRGHEDSRLMLSVADTGIGIAADHITRLFAPFTQAESSTTRRYGGTGIGLSICRRLARAMQGDIAVTSELGAGSTFTLDIPVRILQDAWPTPLPPPGRQLALLIGEGPVKQALGSIAADLALELVGEITDRTAAIVADGPTLAAKADELRRRSVPLLSVALAEPDATAREGGSADAVLEPPIGGRTTRAMLEAALNGNLAALRSGSTPEPSAPVADFSGLRVLAADDSAINREVLGEALARMQIAVTHVVNGVEAVAAIKAGTYDLVFMDGSMPDMSGYEATRHIRTWEHETGRPATPIVALTAQAFGETAGKWQDCGISDYVMKPFTLATLRSVVERWATSGRSAVLNSTESAREAAGRPIEEAPLLDRSVLDAIATISSPGNDLCARVRRLYVEHAPVLMTKVREAATETPHAMAQAAHALKSISRNIGAVRVADICDRMEERAEEKATPDARDLDELSTRLDQTLAQIAADLAADEESPATAAG